MIISTKDTEWEVYEETLSDGLPRYIIAQSMNVAGYYADPSSVGIKKVSNRFAFPEEFVKEMHDLYHECYENRQE